MPGKMLEVGKNLVQGIWNGISDAASWIWDKISGFCSGIVDKIKGFFGIHSPSKLFADEIGKMLGLGLGEGFDDSLGSVYKDMQNAIDYENSKLTSNLTTQATLKADKNNVRTVTNDNGTVINNTQNFYEKNPTPYEEQKQAKQQLRRLAYGL